MNLKSKSKSKWEATYWQFTVELPDSKKGAHTTHKLKEEWRRVEAKCNSNYINLIT